MKLTPLSYLRNLSMLAHEVMKHEKHAFTPPFLPSHYLAVKIGYINGLKSVSIIARLPFDFYRRSIDTQ